MPKCCRKGGLGYDFKRQGILKKNFRGRKSGQAMAGPADYGPAVACTTTSASSRSVCREPDFAPDL